MAPVGSAEYSPPILSSDEGFLDIRRRHVLFLAGFDPIDVPAQHRRIQREMAKFAKTWQLSAHVGTIEAATNTMGERWRLSVKGPDWHTETTYEPLDWHHIVLAEMARSRIARLFGGLVAFFDFVISGTAWRYCVATWPYALFFLAPFFNLLLFTLGALGGGVLIAWAAGMSGAVAAVTAFVVAIILFVGLMHWPGRRWRVEQAVADWIFARDYMYGRNEAFNALLDGFADRLLTCVQRGDCDEVIVVGHSLGATVAVDVIARAIERDPNLARAGPTVCLLTIGATIPKLALHPAARWLRSSNQRVAHHPGIAWTEYQARRDPISFYNFDPVTLKRFNPTARGKKPRIVLVGLKDFLSPESYRRHKMNHMRLHYQFVMANERRAIYDYFMLICGPAPFVFLSDIPRGALDVFGPDGAYRVQPAHGTWVVGGNRA